jgi:hypothetical protein
MRGMNAEATMAAFRLEPALLVEGNIETSLTSLKKPLLGIDDALLIWPERGTSPLP